MKALTLSQPYASAIALGLKRFETRGWKTEYRGMLAIHASLATPEWARVFAIGEAALGRIPDSLPIGAVVCVAQLVDCRPAMEVALEVSALERLYGDYRPGRWAWQLADVQALTEPCPAKGKQGLWHWQYPKDVTLKARESHAESRA